MEKPGYPKFDKEGYPWKPDIDYRASPELYRVGKGEQGVLICEPYKSEIGAFWKFRNPEIARESSSTIFRMFRVTSKMAISSVPIWHANTCRSILPVPAEMQIIKMVESMDNNYYNLIKALGILKKLIHII